MKDELIESFLNLMNVERLDTVVDFSVLRNFVKFMNTIEVAYMENLYTTELEQKVIERSSKFYNQIVQAEFQNNSYIEYLQWCTRVLLNEETRLDNYLTDATIKIILKNLKQILFFQNSKAILETADSFKTILLKNDISVSYCIKNRILNSPILFFLRIKSQLHLCYFYSNKLLRMSLYP
jgi:hypothetical protein